jgi:hypothetical protein
MIEDKDFIGHIFPQKCGDSLLILEKTNIKDKRGHKYLYLCEFQKYKIKFLRDKGDILKGNILNPLIEQNEFIGCLFNQIDGEVLKVLEKTELKDKKGISLYKCEFQKYPCITYRRKDEIIGNRCLNPLIEKYEFIDKIWLQKCGKSLKIISKGNKPGYWNCIFIEDNLQVICSKHKIKEGEVVHPLLYLTSIGQKEIFNFIKDKYKTEVVNNTYSPLESKEIDIYLPELKIGFEFNGIYWHSQEFKDKNYHLDKLKLANSKGIKLYFIWEDEWNNNKEEIKQWIEDVINNRKSLMFEKEIDKIGYLNENINKTEPILINREGFLCYNCGYKLI